MCGHFPTCWPCLEVNMQEEPGPLLLHWPQQVSVVARGQGLTADSEPLHRFSPAGALRPSSSSAGLWGMILTHISVITRRQTEKRSGEAVWGCRCPKLLLHQPILRHPCLLKSVCFYLMPQIFPHVFFTLNTIPPHLFFCLQAAFVRAPFLSLSLGSLTDRKCCIVFLV